MKDLIDFLKEIEDEMKKQDSNVFKLHYKRNREIFNRLKNKNISNDYYNELIEFNLADKNLIDTWKMLGYENVCCMRCIQPIDHKYNSVCKCRIPNKYNDEEFECDNCSCNGCGSFK